MKSLNKPTDTVQDVYTTCISKVRNLNLKSELNAIISILVTDTANLDAAFNTTTAHTIVSTTNVGGISREEMEKVYTDRMVGQKSPGRAYYDKFRLSAPFDTCPYCGHRKVRTLDHYMPKSSFPSLCVSPINLVPSCFDCNDIKDTYIPTTSSEELLHPYFDNINNDDWLFATVQSINPPIITFFIKTTPIPTVLEQRIHNHFNELELDVLYASEVGEELANIYSRLNDLYIKIGKDGVQEHLEEEFLTRYRYNRNSWKTAFYRALYESDEFCDGGFRE